MLQRTSRLIILAILFCIPVLSGTLSHAQERPAYAIFTAEGKSTSYRKMLKSLAKADIVFFGELHNNSLGHWLELQVLKDLHQNRPGLVMGMEMFEADDQIILDEYLRGMINEKSFLNEAKEWDNYKTDYKPLVDFAKEKKIPVIATNVPRRYANLVYHKGLSALDSLPAETRNWMTPLPFDIDYGQPGYKAMLEGMAQHGAGPAENLVAAQALKDATMAHFIMRHHTAESLFYHINGAYHSKDREGIIAYLRKAMPQLTIATIHTTEQSDVGKLDQSAENKADFIICIPEDMTKTY